MTSKPISSPDAQRAEDEGWQGESEGIDLTLGFLRGKRTDVKRCLRRSTDLGITSSATNTHRGGPY